MPRLSVSFIHHPVRGQSTIEYGMLAAIVIAAVVGMQWFLKGSLMDRWKTVGDEIGFGRLYDPGRTTISVATPQVPTACFTSQVDRRYDSQGRPTTDIWRITCTAGATGAIVCNPNNVGVTSCEVKSKVDDNTFEVWCGFSPTNPADSYDPGCVRYPGSG